MIYKISVKEKDFNNIVNEYKYFVNIKKINAQYGDYLLLQKVDNQGVILGDFLVVKVLLIENLFFDIKTNEDNYACFEIVYNPIEDELRRKNENDKKAKKRQI